MAMAETLAPIRDHLLLLDRDEHGLSVLASRFSNARCEVSDLADPRAWEALLQSANWKAHPIVELYACAGTGRKCKFDEDQIDLQIEMLQVNLLSRMRLTHASLADMTRLQFGRIILIASSSAFQPLPLMTAYAASNAALLSFGEGVAFEVASRGVCVVTVCPGGMATKFQERANVRRKPNETLMAPTEVAAAIMRGVGRGKRTLIISARARGMEIASRILPRRLSVAVWGRLMATLR
jgi:short-subunit dehydrogenase